MQSRRLNSACKVTFQNQNAEIIPTIRIISRLFLTTRHTCSSAFGDQWSSTGELGSSSYADWGSGSKGQFASTRPRSGSKLRAVLHESAQEQWVRSSPPEGTPQPISPYRIICKNNKFRWSI